MERYRRRSNQPDTEIAKKGTGSVKDTAQPFGYTTDAQHQDPEASVYGKLWDTKEFVLG